MHGVFRQEVVGEDRDFFTALTQRRHLDRHDVQPEEEILAELTVRHRALEVAVGGGDDPDVDVHVVLAAEPRELTVLEHLQQLGLQRRAHLADFVQEQRAVIGELELARLVLYRARERPAFEAEQLRLEQFGRQCRAIHFHERFVTTARR